MKKFFILCFSLIILTGCSYFTEHDFKIKNESSLDVIFTIQGYGDTEYTLYSNNQITLSLYDNPKLIFKNNPRVYFLSGVSLGIIYDLPSYECLVSNASDFDITLTEKNGLLGKIYGTSEIIPAHTIKPIIIYTTTPKWQAFYTENESISDALELLNFQIKI